MESLNFNIFNIVIFSGIVHGLIFSFLLFFRKTFQSKTNYYLAGTILALIGSNLQYWLLDVGLISGYGGNLLFIPFEFIMLPFFYIYVKSYLKRSVSNTEISFLFSLFFFTIIYQIIGDVLAISNRIVEVLNLFIEYVSILFTISIIVIVFRIIIDYEKKSIDFDKDTVIIKTRWLKKCLYFGLLLCFVWFISTNYLLTFSSGYYQYYPLWIGISILVYWMVFVSIFQSSVYNDRVEIRKKQLVNLKNINRKKYFIRGSKSFEKVNGMICDRKLYLNPNFSLEELSKETHLSIGYLSQLFSNNSNLNFNDFTSHLRIEEIKRMFSNNEYYNYTIVALGLEAGFNSKSSFYVAFKKFTNKTPMEYKKDVRNN